MPATLEHPRTFVPFSGEIDAEAGLISGVSIIQEGPARGHGTTVDRTTLSQVKKLASKMGKVKAKFDHFSGVAATIGYYDSFHIRGDKLLGNLHVFNSFADREHLFEMVQKIPAHFGVSILFDPDASEFDSETETYRTRVRELFSADIVDVPAANADGIFQRLIDSNSDGMGKETTPPLDEEVEATKLERALRPILEPIIRELAEMKSAFTALSQPKEPPPETEPGAPPEPPAPPPQPDAKAFAKEILAEIRLQQAAPTITVATAGYAVPAKPKKSYEEARKEAIGERTGMKRFLAATEFEKQFPTEAEYNAAKAE